MYLEKKISDQIPSLGFQALSFADSCHFCSSVTFVISIAKLSLIHLKGVPAISQLTVLLLLAHTGQLHMSKIRTPDLKSLKFF